jgi:signal transduction histidine kinase
MRTEGTRDGNVRPRLHADHWDEEEYDAEYGDDDDLDADDDAEEVDESAYDRAERMVRRKSKVASELLWFGLVVGGLLLIKSGAAFWVGLFWGLSLFGKVFNLWVEPTLRERWIDREVSRQLDHKVRVHRERIEGDHSRHIEELAAGVAHDIRNPITAAKSLVQQMGEDPRSRDNVGYAEVALDELERVEKSISHLLQFAREPDFVFEEMDLRDVLDGALFALRERIERDGVDLRTSLDGPTVLWGDPEKLRRVTLNLLNNALDAVAAEARPRVDIATGGNLAGTEIWLRVRDNGPGIAPEQLERIWSPFYTSKEDGTGLGLALTRKIVEGHGGSIEVRPGGSRGTEFLLSLPQRREEGQAS